MDDARPITNGIIMCGNTTTSRSGTKGKVSWTSMLNTGMGVILVSRARLSSKRSSLVIGFDDFARDDTLTELLLIWTRVHQVEHRLFDDHSQAARPNLPFDADSAVGSS